MLLHNNSHHDRAALLDHYYDEIKAVILSRQNPVTGLLPASTAITAHGDYTDAWVRDNVYSILAAWGLALAYRKVDADGGRSYELEGAVIKLMRGLLFAMMRQAPKVEAFKQTQSPRDALHAKYDTQTGSTVVGDDKWGHLQIDATSLYLLMLGQMTASGLPIILTIDEVNFVQNLVYYIGRAYQTADYGIWERGNKINSGFPELNASSIGMAKAALEALNGLDLFGVRGSQASVLHVLPDEIARAQITLESLLPRESRSKEVDAALLSIIGFPAFAVDNDTVAEKTRGHIIQSLLGNYGCKRFLRDGHQTVLEDHSRLHYEPWELKQFERIESEWPLFFTYLWLDALFRADNEAASLCQEMLEKVLVERDGLKLLPELFYVPHDRIEAEKELPHSQSRLPNENLPLVWAQSLYYLGRLFSEGLLHGSDLDPLGRHRKAGAPHQPVVQIALLAEDETLQADLEADGILTQTPEQIAPIQVRRSEELAGAYSQIGRNDKLRLTGRPVRRLRTLTTSKVFRIRGEVTVFLPSFGDAEHFYLSLDERVLTAQIKSELSYIRRHWRGVGRPTMTLLLSRSQWGTGSEALLELFNEMQSGQCGGLPVRLGRIGQLSGAAAKERIDFLHDFQFAGASLKNAEPPHFYLSTDPEDNLPLKPVDALEIEIESDVEALIRRLRVSRNLFEQIELLHRLSELKGTDFNLMPKDESITVRRLLDDVYAQAARGDENKQVYWAVVRRAAALLGKVDFGLADAVTDILVRQKQVTVGKAYFEDALITCPLLPDEIVEKIRRYAGEDLREIVLTQEILVFLGLLLKSEPELFSDLLTLRVGYFILLLTTELADELNVRQDEAHEVLMALRPSEIQERLRSVLRERTSTVDTLRQQESLTVQGSIELPQWVETEEPTPEGGWMRLRQRQGALALVPKDFYPQVWRLMHHCKGIVIGDKMERRNRLESFPLLSEMTAGENNFAIWVEHLLNKIEFPEYRQLNIEALQALALLTHNTEDLWIDDFITMDVLIGHAVRQAWLERFPEREIDYDEDKVAAWQNFYESAPSTCARCVAKAFYFLSEANAATDEHR
jgi:phosphorylase kinase alpha/beta subunit